MLKTAMKLIGLFLIMIIGSEINKNNIFNSYDLGFMIGIGSITYMNFLDVFPNKKVDN